MKQIFIHGLIIFIFSLAFFRCDDAGLVDADKTDITGTVNNWSQGIKLLKAVVLDSIGANRIFLADSTTIGSDGSFSLKLKPPPDNLLYKYGNLDTSCTHHLLVTPSDLKYCRLVFRVFDTTNAQIGTITRRNYNSVITSGSFFDEYLYFSGDASLLGKDTCSSFGGQIITDVNLTGSKKWNKSVVLFNTYNPPVLVKVSLSNTEPNGGWWSFGP